MIAGLFFAFWRWMEIITLIPILGMLAYFVNGFVSSNVLTPDYILILFITSVIAAVWAMLTLLGYHRARNSAFFVAFIDLCIAATLIAAVVTLRSIGKADCRNFREDDDLYRRLGPFGSWGAEWESEWAQNPNKTCSMLKASFALAIMNVVFFLFTSFLALFVHRKHREKEVVRREESHAHRHGHRRSASRNSRHSHRSHHSHRRQYY